MSSITSRQELNRAREHIKCNTWKVESQDNLLQIPASLPLLQDQALCSSIPQPYLALPFHPSSFIFHQLLQKPLSTQGLGTPFPTPQDADSILLWDNLHGSQLPIPHLLLRGDTSRFQMTTTKLQISYPHFSCLSSWKPKKIKDW